MAHLQATDFLRLAKDCQVVGAGASTGRIGSNKKATTPPTCQSRQSRSPSSRPRRKRGLGPALVNLAFASVIQRRPVRVLDLRKLLNGIFGGIRLLSTKYSPVASLRVVAVCSMNRSDRSIIVTGRGFHASRCDRFHPAGRGAWRRPNRTGQAPSSRILQHSFVRLTMLSFACMLTSSAVQSTSLPLSPCPLGSLQPPLVIDRQRILDPLVQYFTR